MLLTDKLPVKAAVKAATDSEYKIQVGSVIFDGKKILSVGCNGIRNHRKLHPKFQKFPGSGSIHAEIDAILKARRDLKGMSLLVVRINKQGKLMLSKPCSNCIEYLNHVGIKNVYYSLSSYPYIAKLK